MKKIEVDFLPYTESEELKILGYDFNYVKPYAEIPFNNGLVNYKSPILFQSAFRWFREKYGLNVEISESGLPGKYNVFVKNFIYSGPSKKDFDSHYYAELAAINKMIEIVKQIQDNGNKNIR